MFPISVPAQMARMQHWLNSGRVLFPDSTLARDDAARCQKESLTLAVQQSVIDDLPITPRRLQEMTVEIWKFVH